MKPGRWATIPLRHFFKNSKKHLSVVLSLSKQCNKITSVILGNGRILICLHFIFYVINTSVCYLVVSCEKCNTYQTILVFVTRKLIKIVLAFPYFLEDLQRTLTYYIVDIVIGRHLQYLLFKDRNANCALYKLAQFELHLLSSFIEQGSKPA